MPDIAARIADNLARVRERIADAARRSGREPEEITLVGVTKYVGPQQARALIAAGCRDLGESRPQELWHKAESLRDEPVRWHMIGHLQRNKVARTIPLIEMLHSGDSERLLVAVDRESADLGSRLPVLIEVNVSGEAAKHGLAPEEVAALIDRLGEFGHLEVRGLMAMAGLAGGRDAARADFAQLRQLRDRLRRESAAGAALEELSMGMSRDFDIAIEEGATIVRVGSTLFEGLER